MSWRAYAGRTPPGGACAGGAAHGRGWCPAHARRLRTWCCAHALSVLCACVRGAARICACNGVVGALRIRGSCGAPVFGACACAMRACPCYKCSGWHGYHRYQLLLLTLSVASCNGSNPWIAGAGAEGAGAVWFWVGSVAVAAGRRARMLPCELRGQGPSPLDSEVLRPVGLGRPGWYLTVAPAQ